MIHLLYFIHTQQWLSGFGRTGSTHLALREPDKFYFADPACKRRRISPNLQFLLHQSFCRPSIHWFLCDLEWARCKGSWERIGKGWNTFAFAIAHTNLFTEKERKWWLSLRKVKQLHILSWLQLYTLTVWAPLWLWESRKKVRMRYKIEKADSGLLQMSEHRQHQYMVLLRLRKGSIYI